jgi:hypothetical protein
MHKCVFYTCHAPVIRQQCYAIEEANKISRLIPDNVTLNKLAIQKKAPLSREKKYKTPIKV